MTAPVCIVITGASRGLGRAIAVAFAKCMSSLSSSASSSSLLRIVLVARNHDGLRETEQAVRTVSDGRVVVHCCSIDLGNLETLETQVENELLGIIKNIGLLKQFIFVNNAGSLGHIGMAIDTPSLKHVQEYMNFNVTSAVWLSARLARYASEISQQTVIVNVSSLVAVQAFPTLALYSAGKAARDQYHASLADEIAAPIRMASRIQVISYAPGPLETDMTEELRNAQSLHYSLRPHYQKKLIDPADSASKLVSLVLSGDYVSGKHIDYYDIPDPSGENP